MTQPNQPNSNPNKKYLIFGVCLALMVPLILFVQVSKVIGSTVSDATSFHQLKCSHSEGFCEVLQFKVLQFDYVVTEKIPINNVQKIFLGQKRSYEKNKKRSREKYTYKLHLKTTKENIPLEVTATTHNKQEIQEYQNQIIAFNNWKNKKAGDVFVYQESSINGLIILFGLFCGFIFCAYMLYSFVMFFKRNKDLREILLKHIQNALDTKQEKNNSNDTSKHTNNIIERM